MHKSAPQVEDVYGLSPMQLGMLFHATYEPESRVYFEQTLFSVDGPLDLNAFEQAWQILIQRHPILRSSFFWEEIEKPVQVVHGNLVFSLDRQDWRGSSPDEQQVRLNDFVESDRKLGFDLSKAPLMRVAVARTGEESYRILWSRHHLLLDRWSRAILVDELMSLYDALSHGRAPTLPDTVPYCDFIAWIQQQDKTSAEAFWRKTLDGFASPTTLGIERTSATAARQYYEEQRLRLSPELTGKLQSFARQHKLTLNTLIQGAWALLLSRYSGEDDVVFGATVAGRSAQVPGIERMVGLFINTLPVRAKITADLSVVSWLNQLQAEQAESRQYEYSSLAEVQRFSTVPSGTRLFNTLLVFENLNVAESSGKNGSVRFLTERNFGDATDYPLTILAIPGAEFTLKAVFDTGSFASDSIARMLSHLHVILESMMANPRVNDVALLSSSETKQLLVDWNATSAEYPAKCVHELVKEQAERTPGAAAVIFGDQLLDYAELNRRANRVAHYLQQLGVKPNDRVGFCVERSLDLVVGLLGILKSGGAYVPLDPEYPQERLRFMLEDAGVKVVLTQERLLERLPAVANVVCLDRDAEAIARSSEDEPSNLVRPEDLLYVIYTSGSTGKPKGAALPHRALANLIFWQLENSTVGAGERTLQYTSLSFDVSFQEIFATLSSGGVLVLIEEELRQDPAALLRFLRDQFVARLFLPFVALAHLARAGDEFQIFPAELREVITAGEQLQITPEVARFFSRMPQCRLFNQYGPSETHVVTAYQLAADVSSWPPLPPIGAPIANSQVYVLDRNLRPVPIDIAGDLYLGGACLARGYIGRPELTAERFIPNPWRDGERLYRTGDRARFLPDGNLEFLGRQDHQVKLRGYRVELGEIENVLSSNPAVRDNAVMVREDEPGDKRLFAYVVPAQPGLSLTDLRDWLKARLPEYMVPSRFVALERLPLTPSGKVDRRALPEPGATRELQAHVGPRTPLEEVVAEAFREVLKLDQVGVDEDFFEAGGHSLLAMQVVSRLRGVLQLDIPVRLLFESPTVAQLARRLETAQRQQQIAPPIVPVRRDEPLPLSFAQQRLWFLEQIDVTDSAYNVPLAIRIGGALNVVALGKALNEIVRRHESLRTTYGSVEGSPVQHIAARLEVEIPTIDLENSKDAERQNEITRLVRRVAQQPFDLANGPLLRACLLRLAPQEHIFVLSMHHIACDGWSMGVLYNELSVVYSAFDRSEQSPLPELTIQYADYAAWQRQWLQGEVLEEQIAYWRKHLEGASSLIDLPTDYPRPQRQTFHGAHQKAILDENLTRRLKDLSRREGATLFMALLAAFEVLLSRYSGQEDITVGTPSANRTPHELESLIGFFVNSLPLRVDLSGDPTFRELLQRIREVSLGAYAHQHVPFEMLVERLVPERALNYSPLFQVMFVLQNMPGEALRLGDLQLERLAIENRTSKFDLSLFVTEQQGRLHCNLEYNSDLFDASTAERMLQQFQLLLEAVATNVQRRIYELPLLSDLDRRRLLADANATAAEYARDKGVHQLFEEQAERTPEATAITFEERSLTYAELNSRANQLAHFLVQAGVSAEDRVAICLERSPEMVVALLGVLKSGAAYVPLDPTYPRERIDYIVADSGARFVITQASLESILPEGPQRVALQSDSFADQPTSSPAVRIAPTQLAYVIYTSGSTGKPKGVAVEHGSVVNFLTSMQKQPGMSPHDLLLAVTTISFDIAGLEIYLPLISGAQVEIISREIASDGTELLDRLTRSGASVMQATPATWRLLLSAGWQGTPGLKALCGGEALPRDLAAELVQRAGSVWNMYGPTETTIWSTVYRVTGDEPGAVPIGRPIANTQLYVLDKQQQPVPVGVPGELYIGGPGVARGYLNRQELTAEKFVDNPFQPGTRMYRSGDRARWLPDGNVEYLGREDFQVKIRGFRVELGEIESALTGYQGVREAVALVREDEPGDKRLVAYVVGSAIKPAELRDHLKSKLPDYMVPSRIVELDRLPLTTSGKVDRRALPVPEHSGEVEDFVAPRSAREEVIAEIWSEVLKLPRVGVHDNFFELGGHSLLGMQVIARLRRVLEVDVPVRMLFEAPTVAQLAERLAAGDAATLQAPRLERSDRRGVELPLSFAQQRLWFIEQIDITAAAYNLPQALRLRGHLDVPALSEALNQIVARHEVLRTTFRTDADEPVQVIAKSLRIELPVEDLTAIHIAQRETEARRLMATEAQKRFDLARGPLVRARLFRLSDEDHVLLFTLHHIISDGWSMGVIAQELSALYAAFVAGKPSPLLDLPVQYGDYSLWQRRWLQGDVLDHQLTYWKEKLAGAPALLELPTDKPRPVRQTFHGGREVLRLDADVTKALKQLTRREGTTLFMVLMAAFQAMLSRYTGQEDITVGTPIANRTPWELEPLIGFFVNTLPMRLDLSGEPTFLQLLRRMKEVALGAYAHQQVPFEMVVEALDPKRALSHTPLFQVMFVLQNVPSQTVTLPGLQVERLPVENHTSKFDLSLFMSERDGRLNCSLEYNSDLFEQATAERMLAHFSNLLAGVVRDPEQPVWKLPLLSEDERRQVVVDWNATTTDYPRDKCVHQLFEEQVERTPNATALVFRNDSLTYAQLNARANQLAHYLASLGVTSGDRVGVALDRSLGMIIAFLGIVKAGAAYVPLDLEYPKERLNFLANDAGVRVVICGPGMRQEWPPAAKVITFEDEQSVIDAQSSDNPRVHTAPDDPVYVIYTSGSTGLPKGVEVPHRAVARLMFGVDYARFGPEEVLLQLAPPAFDASTLEIWGALLHGARCVLFPGRVPTAGDLASVIREHGVSLLWLTSTLFNTIVDEYPESLAPVRQLLVGGEALSVPHIRAALRSLPNTALINGYGPTESTTFTCCYPIPRQLPDNLRSIPIGRPIGNTTTYILDAHQQPTAMGVAGELCIGGDGVARGYLNRPELTAEKFVSDPFRPGGRVYRTGDLVRWLPDGNIEFLGRRDAQVKVRGFRIELGEIESAISQHPNVKLCAVAVREDAVRGKALVGYVVPALGNVITGETLRSFLLTKLPEYMVPSTFLFLEHLPLTGSGKVDRRSLGGLWVTEPERPKRAPTEDIERRLAKLWAGVLGRNDIGLDDDFFELGGHSLLAAKLLSRVEREFGKKLSLAMLFQLPILSQQADILRDQLGLREMPRVFAIQPEGTKTPFYCLDAGPMLRPLGQRLGLDRPFLSLWQNDSDLRELSMPFQLRDLASQRVKRLRQLQPKGPYLLSGWCLAAVLAFEMARQLRADGQDAFLALFDPPDPEDFRMLADPLNVQVLVQRAKFHLANLRQLSTREVADYIGGRLGELKLRIRRALLTYSHNARLRTTPVSLETVLYVAVARYHPEPYDGRVVLFRCAEQSEEGKRATESHWAKLATGGLITHTIPGNHASMFNEPNVSALAELLNQHLEQMHSHNVGSEAVGTGG